MDSEGSSGVNFSDVIEVIATDEMYAGVSPKNGEPDSRRPKAYVKITEQPASKALRFRYECEGRSAGSIPGVNSTPENKTFPGIQIVGYQGRAVVVVSCVTKDPPYRPHPHNLVGKEGCNRGVCTLQMNSDTITFSNLGIQCVKKKDIEEALKIREKYRLDPFRTGFSHKVQPSSIDLNCVRLCFQVFLEGPQKDEFAIPLRPVVSDPIYDKKAMSDLTICKLSDCSASVAGGKEIILLCEKVAKEDIQIRFYEERDGELYWEGQGDFQPTQVHKQVAISFRTPKYKNIDIEKPVKVWVQLRRPSDAAVSESVPFQFVPLDSDQLELFRTQRGVCKINFYRKTGGSRLARVQFSRLWEPHKHAWSSWVQDDSVFYLEPFYPALLRRKRQKYGGESSPQNVLRPPQDDDSRSTFVGSPDGGYHLLQVKREPSDTSPVSYMYGNLSPKYPGASPGPPSPNSIPSPVPYSFSNVNLLRHNAGGGLIEVKPKESNPFKTDLSYQSSAAPKAGDPSGIPYPIFPPNNTVNELSDSALYVEQLRLGSRGKADSPGGDGGDVRMPENDSNRSQISGNTGNAMLDMESHPCGLDLNIGHLDSAELTRMAMMSAANLSENLSSNLTLDDKSTKSAMECDQNNMTDSFTRVANNVIQELVSMGDMNQTAQQ